MKVKLHVLSTGATYSAKVNGKKTAAQVAAALVQKYAAHGAAFQLEVKA